MADELMKAIEEDAVSGTPGPWTYSTESGFMVFCGPEKQTDILWYTTDDNGIHGRSADTARIARVPEYEARIIADAAKIEGLESAIKRQAGAAKTLRKLTLDEVQHLKDKDRSEYTAAKTVDSERDANAILTDEVEKLEADKAALLKAAERLGYHCLGCGHLSNDPEVDLAIIRKSGGISCCPERKMEPLSTAILTLSSIGGDNDTAT